jgi:methionyl-tRNA formyltransferase
VEAALGASYQAATFCEGLTIGGYSDWYLPAKKIIDAVRAFTSNPGAWTSHRDLLLKITEIGHQGAEQKLEPGELCVAGKRLFIGTASDSVEIMKIIPAGKKVMTASDWINGARLTDGEVFE